MCYTVIKHSGHLGTLEKCRKHSPAARVFYVSLVFSNARRVLSQCNTRLRLLYLLSKACHIIVIRKQISKNHRCLGEGLSTSCSATFWQLLLFRATFFVSSNFLHSEQFLVCRSFLRNRSSFYCLNWLCLHILQCLRLVDNLFISCQKEARSLSPLRHIMGARCIQPGCLVSVFFFQKLIEHGG